MVKHVPVPVDLPFEPTVNEVRDLFRRSDVPVPSSSMCEEVGEHLGTIARYLGRRLKAEETTSSSVPDHQSDFWKAVDLLESALPGLHSLYGNVRVHPPGSESSISGDEAFRKLTDTLKAASKFVPRVIYNGTPKAFNETECAVRLLKLYEHVFPPKAPNYYTKLSPDGPVPRFIKEALFMISGVTMTPDALYQRLKAEGLGSPADR